MAPIVGIGLPTTPNKVVWQRSESIAATPLEKLPTSHVKRAEDLISGGEEIVSTWLSEAAVQFALRRQGLQAEDVLSALRRCACGEGCAVEARYVRQLVAQVLWQEDMCTATEQHGPCSATDGNSCTLSSGCTTLLPAPPPGTPPSRPSRRPMSARDRCCSQQERARNRAQAEMEARTHKWEKKQQVLNEVNTSKEQRIMETREKARSRNRQKAQQRATVLQERERRQQELHEELKKDEKRVAEQVAKIKSTQQEVACLMCSAAAIRQAMLEVNRQRLHQTEQEAQQVMQDKATTLQAQAEARRAKAIRARSAGPPELRAVRELGRIQAARVDKIREVECELRRQSFEEGSCPHTSSASRKGCSFQCLESTLRQSSSRPHSALKNRPFACATTPRSSSGSHAAQCSSLQPTDNLLNQDGQPACSDNVDVDADIDRKETTGLIDELLENVHDLGKSSSSSSCRIPMGAPEPDVIPWPACFRPAAVPALANPSTPRAQDARSASPPIRSPMAISGEAPPALRRGTLHRQAAKSPVSTQVQVPSSGVPDYPQEACLHQGPCGQLFQDTQTLKHCSSAAFCRISSVGEPEPDCVPWPQHSDSHEADIACAELGTPRAQDLSSPSSPVNNSPVALTLLVAPAPRHSASHRQAMGCPMLPQATRDRHHLAASAQVVSCKLQSKEATLEVVPGSSFCPTASSALACPPQARNATEEIQELLHLPHSTPGLQALTPPLDAVTVVLPAGIGVVEHATVSASTDYPPQEPGDIHDTSGFCGSVASQSETASMINAGLLATTLVTQIAEQQMQVFSSCPPAASYAEMGAQGCSSDGAAVKQQLMSALADDTRSQVRTCKPPPRGVSTVVSDPEVRASALASGVSDASLLHEVPVFLQPLVTEVDAAEPNCGHVPTPHSNSAVVEPQCLQNGISTAQVTADMHCDTNPSCASATMVLLPPSVANSSVQAESRESYCGEQASPSCGSVVLVPPCASLGTSPTQVESFAEIRVKDASYLSSCGPSVGAIKFEVKHSENKTEEVAFPAVAINVGCSPFGTPTGSTVASPPNEAVVACVRNLVNTSNAPGTPMASDELAEVLGDNIWHYSDGGDLAPYFPIALRETEREGSLCSPTVLESFHELLQWSEESSTEQDLAGISKCTDDLMDETTHDQVSATTDSRPSLSSSRSQEPRTRTRGPNDGALRWCRNLASNTFNRIRPGQRRSRPTRIPPGAVCELLTTEEEQDVIDVVEDMRKNDSHHEM